MYVDGSDLLSTLLTQKQFAGLSVFRVTMLTCYGYELVRTPPNMRFGYYIHQRRPPCVLDMHDVRSFGDMCHVKDVLQKNVACFSTSPG